MYELLSKTIDKQFSKGAFKSGFFEKDDLISDLYLYLSDFDKDFSEQELLEIIKKKYFNYFEIYDIKDGNSYDKFEDSNNRGVQEREATGTNSKTVAIYEYFEKIIWKDGVKCPKCKSKDCYPNKDSYRQHDCRNCGNTFSFTVGTNLSRTKLDNLKNILKVHQLLLKGVICFKEIQDTTRMSKSEIKTAYFHSIPNIINDEPLIKKVSLKSLKEREYLDFKEHDHQTKTIIEAVEYFQNNDRGKVIHPCGSGKTYTAIRILKELDANRIIVVIPSRVLMYQQIEVFLKQFNNYKFYAFGSLSQYKKQLKSLRVSVLSETVELQKKQIPTIKNEKCIVFTTLESFETIGNLFCENFFDFGVFDEAHRIAGDQNKTWLKVIDFKCYRKALFLTATEKNFNGDGIGMNDGRFGENISKIYMREMIDADVITDYNIVNISFKDSAIKEIIENNKEFFVDVKIKLPVKTRILLSAISLIKCIEKYKVNKIITYHSTIEESVLFINFFKLFQTKYGLNHECYNLHSRLRGHEFSNNVLNFTRSEKAVISSVNSFQEGIDVTDVDAVLYAYPKKSKIDIVQTLGRCIRKSEGKEKGIVIIPDNLEGNRDYRRFVEVLNALESADDRITEFKTNAKNSFSKNVDFIEYVTEAELTFDSDYFYRNIEFYLRGETFLSYEEAKIYAISNNIKKETEWHKNCPNNLPKKPSAFYKEWRGWRDFLETKRIIKDKKLKLFLNYKDAVEYLKTKEIKSGEEYKKWSKSTNFPNFLYKDPRNTYKEWETWSKFLSVETKYSKNRQFLSYNDCKKYAQDNNILTRKGWNNFDKPLNFPQNPDVFYKADWISWSDFLGVGHERKVFISYQDAKKWIKENNITEEVRLSTTWRKYMTGNMKLTINNKIPKYPQSYYKDDWKGWDDFLGRDKK